jgi:hypothetical protein
MATVSGVSITLTGNPVTGFNNAYGVTIVVNSGSATTPSGTVTILDSITNSVSSSTWTLLGSGVAAAGTISFTASGIITQEENGNTTVTATYSGGDYTFPASNVIKVSSRGELTTSPRDYTYTFLQQTFPVATASGGYGSQDNTYLVFQSDQYRPRNAQPGN